MSTITRCLFYRFPLHYRDHLVKKHSLQCHILFRSVTWRGVYNGIHTQESARQKYGTFQIQDVHLNIPFIQASMSPQASLWHYQRIRKSPLCIPLQHLHWLPQTKLLSVTDFCIHGVQNMSYSTDSQKKSELVTEKEKVPSDSAEIGYATSDPSVKSDVQLVRKQVKKIGGENLPSKILRYFLGRYTWYLKRFQQSLENEMPDTFKMFRIFSVGLKEFIIDFKDFMMVLAYLSLPGSTLRTCTRRELELYYSMPRDMIRVFPVLALSSVPLGQNIAFPIGYWFPRHLLCHHFWDIKQRHDFAVQGLKKRLFNYRPVFRSLQATLNFIDDEIMQEKCRAVFYKLGSGIHPTIQEIVGLLPLFRGEPYHIRRIYAVHARGLLRLHGRSVYFMKRKRLEDHARQIHYLDAAISREGIDSLTNEQLKDSLFLRGLNPTNMSTKAMTEYLESWLKVSREVDSSSYSLLLHLPILLAYNQPTNIVLIY